MSKRSLKNTEGSHKSAVQKNQLHQLTRTETYTGTWDLHTHTRKHTHSESDFFFEANSFIFTIKNYCLMSIPGCSMSTSNL